MEGLHKAKRMDRPNPGELTVELVRADFYLIQRLKSSGNTQIVATDTRKGGSDLQT